MDLSGVISISGRPGLYKVIAQGKNSIIVESLMDKKRFPAYSTDRISALEDISIYTVDDDKPLKGILEDIYAKQEGKEAPSHKEDLSVLQAYFTEILPDYDEERVYPSDIKKLFQWYNLLLNAGLLVPTKDGDAQAQEEGTESDLQVKESKAKEGEAKAPKAKKAAAPKKATAAPKNDAKSKAKPSAPKKTVAKAKTQKSK